MSGPVSGATPDAVRPSGRRGPPPPVVILLGILLVAPALLWNRFAQDAVPFVVAGEFARDDGEDVYTDSGDLFTTPPRFADRSCEISPPGTDCANEIVAFVGPPSAIAVAVAVSLAGDAGGPFVLRCACAGALVAGLWLLRRRVLAHDPDADGTFLVATLLLVPMVMVPLALGQTSPLMFLSAAIGLRVARRSRVHAVGVGALWGAIVAIKLSPLLLAVVLVWRRQWTALFVGLGVVVLAVIGTVPFGGSQYVEPFRESLAQLEESAARNPHNGSVEAFLHALAPDLTGTGGQTAVLWIARAALALLLLSVGRRIVDEDVQWAWAWTAMLLFVPLVWWHYVWVAFAGLVLVLATRPRRERPWRLLVVAAALTVPMSLVNGSDQSLPVGQFLFLLASVVLISMWAPKGHPAGLTRPPVDPTGAHAPAPVAKA